MLHFFNFTCVCTLLGNLNELNTKLMNLPEFINNKCLDPTVLGAGPSYFAYPATVLLSHW